MLSTHPLPSTRPLQIIAIVKAKSAEGLSLTANLSELLCFTVRTSRALAQQCESRRTRAEPRPRRLMPRPKVNVAYNVRLSYPFNTYGEVFACWLQDLVIGELSTPERVASEGRQAPRAPRQTHRPLPAPPTPHSGAHAAVHGPTRPAPARRVAVHRGVRGGHGLALLLALPHGRKSRGGLACCREPCVGQPHRGVRSTCGSRCCVTCGHSFAHRC
jgi:hypothetical protein